MTTILRKENEVLVEQCVVARNFFTRFLGLMGRTHLPANEAIIFPKCNSIHTFFMRMPIDVVFVSATGEVVRVLNSLSPWRLLLPIKGAVHTIELGPDQANQKKIRQGDRLICPGVFE